MINFLLSSSPYNYELGIGNRGNNNMLLRINLKLF